MAARRPLSTSPANCWCAMPVPDPRYGFFREYLKDPEATAEAWEGGWFHTGDVVRRGADGVVAFRRPQEERHPPLRRKHLGRRGGKRTAAAPRRAGRSRCAALPTRCAATRCSPAWCSEGRSPDAHAKPGRGRYRRMVPRAASPITRRPAMSPSSPAVPLTSTQKIQRGALKELVATTIGSEAVRRYAPAEKAAGAGSRVRG